MSLTDSNNRPEPQAVRRFLLGWQRALCSELERLQQRLFPSDAPAPFRFDHWQRNGQSQTEPDATAAGVQNGGKGDTAAGAMQGSKNDGTAKPISQSANGDTAPPGRSSAVQKQTISQSANEETTPPGPARRRGLQGGGISAVAAGGALWEKAGVNFSHVSGASLPPAASARHPHLSGRTFEAMGVSVVIHPLNPYVPTMHANIRFLSTAADAGQKSDAPAIENAAPAIWWFGGGFDLTPYYGFQEDVVHWHKTARDACLPFGAELYPQFKQWCDRYFYLPHRNEARGVGGLFFDDITCDGHFDTAFALARSIAGALLAAYLPIVERRAQTPYGERERNWQLYRRGRYVEFNLVCDRGTHFGLQSRGRTESILMSLPPLVRWEYDYHPQPGSPEAALLEHFLPPRDWLAP